MEVYRGLLYYFVEEEVGRRTLALAVVLLLLQLQLNSQFTALPSLCSNICDNFSWYLRMSFS